MTEIEIKPKRKRVVNPFTEKKLPKKASDAVHEARAARAGARKAARSGHPGRRAEAQRALAGIPQYIRNIFALDAQQR